MKIYKEWEDGLVVNRSNKKNTTNESQKMKIKANIIKKGSNKVKYQEECGI